MVADGHLSAEHHAGAQRGAAGHAGLPGDQAMGADGYVVRHLHQVIDLGSPADARGAELGAIDADAGADLHVVFDDHGTNLRNLGLLLAVPAVAESIGAQDAAGVDDDARSDGDALPNGDVGEDFAGFAERDVIADEGLGVDDRTSADFRPPADVREGPDGDIRADLRGRIDRAIASIPRSGRAMGCAKSPRTFAIARSASSTSRTAGRDSRAQAPGSGSLIFF